MANQLTLDPMTLDTAGSPISTGRILNIFKSVEWTNPVNLEDRVYLIDANGAIVCDFTCTTPKLGSIKYFGEKGQIFTGPFTLSLLDSGKLLIARV